MALGCIPRFSPSFSSRELRAAAVALLRPPPDEPAILAFEERFASYIGAKHAVMVPSARFGFYLLLKAFGLEAGDEVIIPSMTYFAIPGIAATGGFKPVFADTELTTYTLDPEAFEAAITPRTRAVVPTHLFGAPVPMDKVLEIAKKHGIKVIEDCAQATGARYRGRRVGSFGDAAYYTFGLTKNITTLKGAMVTTDDDTVAERVRAEMARCTPTDTQGLWKEVLTGTAMMLATHPLVYPFALHPVIRASHLVGHDPIHDRFGEPESVADEISPRYWKSGPRAAQAMVGQAQLDRIDALNGARQRNGRFLDQRLAHVPDLIRPTWPVDSEPIFMSYVVQHPRRDALALALLKHGVDTTTGYMTDASTSPLFERFWGAPCPNATRAHRDLLHLPVHPNLREKDVIHIAEATRLAAHAV